MKVNIFLYLVRSEELLPIPTPTPIIRRIGDPTPTPTPVPSLNGAEAFNQNLIQEFFIKPATSLWEYVSTPEGFSLLLGVAAVVAAYFLGAILWRKIQDEYFR